MAKAKSEFLALLFMGVLFLGFMGVFFLVVMGPIGIQNKFTSWKASAYGSNWYIVHYLPDGSLNEYYLENAAVHSEEHSDGIYFTFPEKNKNVTIHLSTFHEHVQDPTAALIQGLRGGRKVGYSNIPPNLVPVDVK